MTASIPFKNPAPHDCETLSLAIAELGVIGSFPDFTPIIQDWLEKEGADKNRPFTQWVDDIRVIFSTFGTYISSPTYKGRRLCDSIPVQNTLWDSHGGISPVLLQTGTQHVQKTLSPLLVRLTMLTKQHAQPN